MAPTAPASPPAPAAREPKKAEAATEDATAGTGTSELSAVVDDLLENLSEKFTSVSAEIFNKIDAMTKRLDQMEQTLQQSSGK